MNLQSTAFAENGEIPARYTCDGENISPPLEWSDAPDGTRSFTLIVDDPDAPDPAAPQRTWIHWVVYNLPATTTGLEENVGKLPGDALNGLNDWKKQGYGGPCPPIGRHRYMHKLYALDLVLPLPPGATKAQVEEAMKGHILAQTTLTGTYQKAR